MKINADTIMKSLSHEDLDFNKEKGEKLTFGKALANIFLTSTNPNKDPLKFYSLATKFHDGGEVEIDASDVELVKNEIKATAVYNILVSGQMLQQISQSS